MTVRTIPSLALGAWLTLVRFPIDAVLRVGSSSGSASSVKLTLDRAEAAVRGLAGAVLADDSLKIDARRRSEAADERERALRLRVAAKRASDRADARVADQQTEADRRRRSAAKSADRRRGQANERRESAKKKAAATTRGRRESAKRSAVRSEQEIEERAKQARVQQLDTKLDALETRQKAQVAADEARRLRAAASKAKAGRKG
jgi:hypothetical protein